MDDTSDIKLLDGGFSTELGKIYEINSDPLWSARALHTHPSAVVDVHKRYLASGAQIITTASYQASIDGFMKHLKLPEEECVNILKSSAKLAKQAKTEYMEQFKNSRTEILIAGSIGPYGAALADGSEYTGNYCENLSHEDLANWHRQRIQYLVEEGVDVLAFETIPAAKEGEALMKLLHEFPGTKAWLSFSCQSLNQTAHKESIGKTVKACVERAPAGQLMAVGVNCCPPSYVESLLKNIGKEVPNFPLIAYPNSGEKWVSNVGWIDDREDSLVSYVSSWIDASVSVIGGCCRTTPEDIEQIAQYLKYREK